VPFHLTEVEGVSFILTPFLAALSRREPAFTDTFHDSCLAQGTDKRDIPLLFLIIHIFRISVIKLNCANEN